MKSLPEEQPRGVRQYPVTAGSPTRLDMTPGVSKLVVASRAGDIRVSVGSKDTVVPPGGSATLAIGPKDFAIYASLLDAGGVGCIQVTEFFAA